MVDEVTKRAIGETKEDALRFYKEKIFKGHKNCNYMAEKMVKGWPYNSFYEQAIMSQKIYDECLK